MPSQIKRYIYAYCRSNSEWHYALLDPGSSNLFCTNRLARNLGIKVCPVSYGVLGLRRFLGITGYYRRFIPDYGKIASPLYYLMKDDTEWEWSEACQTAFESLKKLKWH